MSTAVRSFLRKRWWQLLLAFLLVLVAGLWFAARSAASRLEPFARQKFIAYLEDRFHADVEIGALRASLPLDDPFRFVFSGGKGARLHLAVDNLKVRQRGLEDLPPLLTMASLQVVVDFPTLWEDTVLVKHVQLDNFRFVIPPKDRRPKLRTALTPDPAAPPQPSPAKPAAPRVVLEEINADGMVLEILSQRKNRAPLVFEMARLRLFGATPGSPMRYEAKLSNPKPPGLVDSTGTFGPFLAEEPGESPLGGDYVFEKADLNVFKGITGTLRSTGRFSGKLNRIIADGISDTPDFGLSYSKNRVRLQTKYHAIIDGTNGDTELRPVEATLGSTRLLCEGAVERYPGENGKTVALKVKSTSGNLDDILKLAMKDASIPLRGKLTLDIDLKVPPGKQPYADRLEVSGKFLLNDGQFTHMDTQAKLNDMSSRATGHPNDAPEDDVTSDFDGKFRLADRTLHLSELRFYIPGAEVALDGNFNLATDVLDFHGILRTDARLSQMMKSRWKRWALKPVDPFFAKNGAGAQFKIAITGSRDKPNFGLDRGK